MEIAYPHAGQKDYLITVRVSPEQMDEYVCQPPQSRKAVLLNGAKFWVETGH